MKILIADDQMSRYQRLMTALENAGVSREEIDIVASANSTRDCLQENQYDLLILDILLPLNPEDSAFISTNSLDLLFEISEGSTLQKPSHIVGITGDKSIVKDAESSFAESTWIVVEYSASNDEWIQSLVNCVKYIQSNTDSTTRRPQDFDVDLAIICALETPEMEEVLKLDWNWSVSTPIDEITFIHTGWFYSGDRKMSVAATCAPRIGMVSAAIVAAKIVSLLRPRLLVMCGICAGVEGKVKLGDVLFADPVWDFQSGKQIVDQDIAKLSIAPHQIAADPMIRSHVKQVSLDSASLAEIYTSFGSDAHSVPKIHIGPVATGSAVLADGQVIKNIKSQHRELIGVEMEIYGVYAAANGASHPSPKCFALKSVCDFANPDKNNEIQRYAAFTSARVLQLLMNKHGIRLVS